MRVIAGQFGGRRLVAPRGLATRPTSDRAREALFSILADVRGARVLDLYAGTGALGIEAISRGAAHVLFIESARPALAVIRENLETLGIEKERARVIGSPVARALGEIAKSGPYDLVLADPPYADVADALAEIAAPLLSATSEGARFVLEHASRDVPPDVIGFERSNPRAYGDTSMTIYLRGA
jgi:16S rRNA (guanine966-N2)-methyltransferase